MVLAYVLYIPSISLPHSKQKYKLIGLYIRDSYFLDIDSVRYTYFNSIEKYGTNFKLLS